MTRRYVSLPTFFFKPCPIKNLASAPEPTPCAKALGKDMSPDTLPTSPSFFNRYFTTHCHGAQGFGDRRLEEALNSARDKTLISFCFLSEWSKRKLLPLPLLFILPRLSVRGGLVNHLIFGWPETGLTGQSEGYILLHTCKVDTFRTNLIQGPVTPPPPPPATCYVCNVRARFPHSLGHRNKKQRT